MFIVKMSFTLIRNNGINLIWNKYIMYKNFTCEKKIHFTFKKIWLNFKRIQNTISSKNVVCKHTGFE